MLTPPPSLRAAVRAALILALAAAAGGAAPSAPTAPTPTAGQERADLLAAFRERMLANDLAGAAGAARGYLNRFPGDGDMSYNLACVEARRGAMTAAWTALVNALATPQADPRHVESDPDLAPLRSDPRLAALLAETRARLRSRAEAARLVLREGFDSKELRLAPSDGSRPDADWPQVDVRLQTTPASLVVTAQVRDTHFRDRPQPWRNGDGFRITLVIPPARGASGFDGEHSFGFGFGLQNRAPIGALLEQDGQPRRLDVAELAPKVRFDPSGDLAYYTIRIPWGAIAPYAPPVDTLLGVNISYLSVGNDRVRRTVALIADPALGGGGGRWRRYVPVACRASELSEPLLCGALSTAVVSDAPLGIRLVARARQATTGTLRVQLLDVTDRSVVRSGGADSAVTIAPGLNSWERIADLSGLTSGPFRVRATLATVGRDTLRWQTDLLRLEPGWLEQASARAAKTPPADRPSLDYRLEAIGAALTDRAPRALPSALSATIVETSLLLRRQERSGTVMPDTGAFLAAFRDPAGALRPCAVRIPVGFRPAEPHRLLLLLTGRGLGASRNGQLLASTLRAAEDLVVASPRLPLPAGSADAADAGDPLATATAALHWARERFGAGPVLLAGVDDGAADALALSLAQPSLCERVMLIVGTGVRPWEGVPAAALAADLRARPNRLAYTVLDTGHGGATGAPASADTAADIAALLQAAGFRTERRTHAGGTLSGRDALDLLAAWAGSRR